MQINAYHHRLLVKSIARRFSNCQTNAIDTSQIKILASELGVSDRTVRKLILPTKSDNCSFQEHNLCRFVAYIHGVPLLPEPPDFNRLWLTFMRENPVPSNLKIGKQTLVALADNTKGKLEKLVDANINETAQPANNTQVVKPVESPVAQPTVSDANTTGQPCTYQGYITYQHTLKPCNLELNGNTATFELYDREGNVQISYIGSLQSNGLVCATLTSPEMLHISIYLPNNEGIAKAIITALYCGQIADRFSAESGGMVLFRLNMCKSLDLSNSMSLMVIASQIVEHSLSFAPTQFDEIAQLPFNKYAGFFSTFVGVYTMYAIHNKEFGFIKLVVEIRSDMTARLKGKTEFTGFVKLKIRGEVLYIYLESDGYDLEINLDTQFKTNHSLYGTYTGIDRKNFALGGKVFFAKQSEAGFDDLKIESISPNDDKFSAFAALYPNFVPYFQGIESPYRETYQFKNQLMQM